jgi:hypothetical protein
MERFDPWLRGSRIYEVADFVAHLRAARVGGRDEVAGIGRWLNAMLAIKPTVS